MDTETTVDMTTTEVTAATEVTEVTGATGATAEVPSNIIKTDQTFSPSRPPITFNNSKQ